MSQEASLTQTKKSYRVPIVGAIAVVVLAIAFNAWVGGKFLTVQNFSIMLVTATVPALVAWGLNFMFSSNITDLSAGSVIIVSATVAGTLANSSGYVAMFAGGILAGVACLALNMVVFQTTKIPPWIAGLGMTMVYEAIIGYYAQYRVSQGLKVVSIDTDKRMFGQAPMIYVMLALGFVIAYLIYNKTSLGLNVRAVGGNEEVARMMGINTRKALLMGAIVAGFFFGFAGVVKEGYAGMVLAQTGLSSISTIFQPLAAVLLAQALQRYINIIIAIPISTYLIAMVFNMLTLAGVPSGTFQEFVLGFIVIIFGAVAQRTVKGVVK